MFDICFINQWMKRSKHGLIDWPIVLQHDVKAKYRLVSKKFSGMKFFHPSVRLTIVSRGGLVMKPGKLQRNNSLLWFLRRHVITILHTDLTNYGLTNQKPRAFNLYPFDKPIKSLYFHSFVVSVLFTRFHFKVIRKLL